MLSGLKLAWRMKFLTYTRPIFFVLSSRFRVDHLSYESKTTDKQQQNDWRAKKNLDGNWKTKEWTTKKIFPSSFMHAQQWYKKA